MQEHFSDKVFPLLKNLYNDKILIFAGVIIVVLAIGNIVNKIILGFEPLQYHLFSYDKVLHLLAAVIIVRSLFWILNTFNNPTANRNLLLISSLIALILYAFLWEIFELFTFLIQGTPQFWQELFDVPLDILYDVVGVLVSNILGYKI